MFKQGRLAGAAMLALYAAPAWAEDGQSLAAKFGALESIQDISLSPDGNQVSIIRPMPDKSSVLMIANFATGGLPKAILRQSNAGESLRWCSWSTDTRLACQISTIYDNGGQLLGFTRIVAVNSDGSQIAMVTPRTNVRSMGYAQNGGSIIDWDLPGSPGHVLMTREVVPEESIGTNIVKNEAGLAVDDVDLTTLKRKPVERGKPEAVEYISDGQGTVRIMGLQSRDPDGYLRPRLSYSYRKQNSRSWEGLSQIGKQPTGAESGFDPYAVDSKANVAYGFDDNKGFSALYSVSLDGLATKTLLLSRPDVDVDSLVRIGRDRRVVGASYASERRMTEFFDPELKKLSTALGKALPGQPAVSFVDASMGEQKLLLFASSDTNPGMFYRFDKLSKRLEEVLPVRDALTGLVMGKMKPITYTAADGTTIPGYLTLPPGSDGKGLPAIVMPHGGPASRDEWGFDWLVQYFAMRGFAVLQPNFRGSAGYGADWYKRNGFQSWRTSIGDVNDAGRWLVSQGIAQADKLAIVGWSYGGYAALQSSVLDPDLFKAIVAIAPVTDLERLRMESRDFINFPIVDKFIGNGPHVREGSPAQNTARFKAPVLMFHGDKDQNVGVEESRFMQSRLKSSGKQAELVLFPGLDHQLADAAARTRLLADSDAFLRKNMGLPAN